MGLIPPFPDADTEQAQQTWFDDVAERLLSQTKLHAFGHVCRLLEIEFYLHAPSHPDPFTHCSEAQGEFLRWYLHRTGRGFRSGSFKGIDLTVGGDAILGGILIRSLETPSGDVVNGPSLCVDALLAMAEVESVRELHELIGQLTAVDSENPVRIGFSDDRRPDVYRSSRVGLSLKEMAEDSDHLEYVLRRYRFLTRPRTIRKGRVHLVLALHRQGIPAERIRAVTGSPVKKIHEYIRWADVGAGTSLDRSFSPTSARDVCNLSYQLEAKSNG